MVCVGNDVKKRKNKGAKDVNDYGIFTLAGLKSLNIETSGKHEGLNARLNSFGASHLPKASLPCLRPFRTPAAHLNPRTLHVPFSDASWALWQRDSLDGCCITELYQRNLYNSINQRRRHKFNKIKKKKNSWGWSLSTVVFRVLQVMLTDRAAGHRVAFESPLDLVERARRGWATYSGPPRNSAPLQSSGAPSWLL